MEERSCKDDMFSTVIYCYDRKYQYLCTPAMTITTPLSLHDISHFEICSKKNEVSTNILRKMSRKWIKELKYHDRNSRSSQCLSVIKRYPTDSRVSMFMVNLHRNIYIIITIYRKYDHCFLFPFACIKRVSAYFGFIFVRLTNISVIAICYFTRD